MAVVQGLSLLAAVLGLYVWALGAAPAGEARGAAFLALILGNLVLALADSRSGAPFFAREHRVYWTIAGAVSLVMGIIFLVPMAAHLFEVTRPPPALTLLALAAALAGGGWTALWPRAPRPTGGLRHSLR